MLQDRMKHEFVAATSPGADAGHDRSKRLLRFRIALDDRLHRAVILLSHLVETGPSQRHLLIRRERRPQTQRSPRRSSWTPDRWSTRAGAPGVDACARCHGPLPEKRRGPAEVLPRAVS